MTTIALEINPKTYSSMAYLSRQFGCSLEDLINSVLSDYSCKYT